MRNLIVMVALAVIAAACGTPSLPTPTASPAPSSTPTASPTETPPVPTIRVDGTEVPDPTVSNPELFDLTDPEAPIPQFMSAMKMVGVEADGQAVSDFLAAPASFHVAEGPDGQRYVLGFYTAKDKAETVYALKFIYDEQGGWRSFRFKDAKLTHGIIFGTRLSSRSIAWNYNSEDVRRIDELVLANYSHAIIEHLNWTETEPQVGTFTFVKSDRVVSLAVEKQLTMEGDDLVYGKSNFRTPLKDFVANSQAEGLTDGQIRERLIEIMKNHVSTVVGNYKGTVHQWSVVNEYSPYGKDGFYNIIGPEYVQIAFQAAREADPDARLYFNDTDNETRGTENYQRVLAIAHGLSELGLIDAMGLQMHVNAARPPTEPGLIAAMQGYELPIIVSSLDIDLSELHGTDESRWQKQAEIGKTIVSACVNSGVCHDIYFWDGYGDKYSWLEDPQASGSRASPDADATPFTDEGLCKPMFYAMMAALDQ